MSEIATLEALEARTGLLRQPGNEQQLLENAAAFTRAAAFELAKDDEGWGNVRKTSGVNIRGLDVDKVLHRHTLQMFDIVIGAGAVGQRVGWQPVATGTPSQWVEPAAEAPGPSPEPPDDAIDLLTEIRDLLEDINTTSRAQLAEQHRTNDYLRRAAERFGI